MSTGAGSILRTDSTQLSRRLRLAVTVTAVVGFAALTWLGAQARIPIPGTPVPVTLQTLAVLLAGAVLGASRGGSSQALYLGVGVAGIPVFAGSGAGWGVVAGPTGGYLVGFVVAAALVGWITARRENPGLAWLAFATCTGSVLISACGVLVLALHLGGDFRAALLQGAIVFTPWNFLKALAAAAAARSLRPLSRAIR